MTTPNVSASWRAQLDPELEPFLARMSPAMNAFASLPPAEALAELRSVREMLRRTMAERPRDPASEQVRIQDHLVPGPDNGPEIPIRTYNPIDATGPLPVLAWFHGGGFHRGAFDQDGPLCCRLAVDAGVIVASVGYRLAPEHPFPAGVEDCYAGLCWSAANAARLNIDAARIAVGGRSSGGGMSAAVALMARDRGGPTLRLQLLSQPLLDDRHETASSQEVIDPRLWNGTVSRWAWDAYLGTADRSDLPAYAVPARATDLSGLPAAYLLVAGLDILRDEGIEYASRLIQAGVPTELHVVPGAFHGFDGSAPTAAISKRVRAEYVDVLRSALRSRATSRDHL